MGTPSATWSLKALAGRPCLLLCVTCLLWGLAVPCSADSDPSLLGQGGKARGAESGRRHTSSLLGPSTPSTDSVLLSAISSGRAKAPQDSNLPQKGTSASFTEKRKNSTWYSTAGWLPSQGIRPDRTVNLSVLPMLAFGFFFFGICIKCYSWVRDQDRSKARGQLDFEDDDEVNYHIITAGERGYREVDIRSDSTSMYDTVTSFRSIRLPVNDHTVTSIKSLPNQPYETYRSILLQKADERVYDSVHSYKAFLERSVEMNEVDIEVELVDDYSPRPRSKSYDLGNDRTSHDAARSRRRRLRRHSGGRGLEGGAKVHTERERFRRHSDKSTPHPPHPESIRSKPFHRRSSPAILEPLLLGAEFKIPLEQSEEGEGEREDVGASSSSLPLCALDRQSSNSSSSTGRSSSSSRKRRVSSHKQRRDRRRQKHAASQDSATSTERPAKSSVHSSGHCSDDSPQSSSSVKGSSSNEMDSDSDVTDSGLVVDLQKSAKQSCFKNGASRETSRSVSPGDLDDSSKGNGRKVHRFKVTFVDDATLSAASE